MILGICKIKKIEKLSGYKILRKLGEGRYGVCYIARLNHRQVVIKEVKRQFLSKYSGRADYEAAILSKLDHNAIPKLIHTIVKSDFKGIIIEEKPGLTVESLLFKKYHIFSEGEIHSIGMQLIKIVKYLHRNGIVHRDIRIPNVLVNEGTVFLIDFGLARFSDDKKYRKDIDFSYLGDFLLYLIYSTAKLKKGTKLPWYDELLISSDKKLFLKRLLRIEKPFNTIEEVEVDFVNLF